jgi:hypothetical protein
MAKDEFEQGFSGEFQSAFGVAFPYRISCQGACCTLEARYKVAARWSDGFTLEWKTYALLCADCLSAGYALAVSRRQSCRLTPGESLDRPVILELAPGQPSMHMVRRADLERTGIKLEAKSGQDLPREVGS